MKNFIVLLLLNGREFIGLSALTFAARINAAQLEEA